MVKKQKEAKLFIEKENKVIHIQFITPNVNKDEFLDYVDLIKEYQMHFPNTTNSTKPKCNLDQKAISKPLSTLNTLKIVEDLLPPDIENSLYVNMDKFERNEIISKTDRIKLYKLTD